MTKNKLKGMKTKLKDVKDTKGLKKHLELMIKNNGSFRGSLWKNPVKSYIIKVLNEPELLKEFYQNYEDLKTQKGFYRDYLKAIKFDYYNHLKKRGLLKKNYSWSGTLIQKNEKEYLEGGYTVAYTDYKKNLDNLLFKGVYDFTQGKYMLTPEKLYKKNKQFKGLVARDFKGGKTRPTVSVKNNFEGKFDDSSIKIDDVDSIINEYDRIEKELKKLRTIRKRIDGYFKYTMVDPILEDFGKSYKKDIARIQGNLKDIKGKYKSHISDFSHMADERYAYKSKVEVIPQGADFNLYIPISVSKEYDIKTPDLRKKEVKHNLIDLAGHSKSILKKNGYYNGIVKEDEIDDFIKKSNVLVKKLKGKGKKFKKLKKQYENEGIVKEKINYRIR